MASGSINVQPHSDFLAVIDVEQRTKYLDGVLDGNYTILKRVPRRCDLGDEVIQERVTGPWQTYNVMSGE